MPQISLKKSSKHSNEGGSALVYILIAIALLAALTMTFMEPSSQQTTSQGAFKSASEVESQLNFIRSAIQECLMFYPKGDPCINDSAGPAHCDNPAGVSDTDARKNYPIKPNSTFYTNATPAAAADRKVSNLRCPGNNPGDTADHDNHGMLFSGSSGKFLPPAPPLFEDWQYYNGGDGIFFWTETSKTDAFLTTALQKLDDKFATCEVDIIDATGGAEDLDSDTTLTCTNGSTCFRVWVLANASSKVLVNVDTGCD